MFKAFPMIALRCCSIATASSGLPDICSSQLGDSMKNQGSQSVDRIAATKVSKLLTMLPRALRLLLLSCAFAPRQEKSRESPRKTVADQQEALSVTKAGPLDDASDVIEKVDGIQIVDQPQHAVFKISRTRPPLGLRANQG